MSHLALHQPYRVSDVDTRTPSRIVMYNVTEIAERCGSSKQALHEWLKKRQNRPELQPDIVVHERNRKFNFWDETGARIVEEAYNARERANR